MRTQLRKDWELQIDAASNEDQRVYWHRGFNFLLVWNHHRHIRPANRRFELWDLSQGRILFHGTHLKQLWAAHVSKLLLPER